MAQTVTGVAAFAVDRSRRRVMELERARRLAGASVIKPLLFWAGASTPSFAGDPAGWAALAEPGITASDNQATAALWREAGEDALLAWLHQRLGVSWRTGPGEEHPCLRVMVTAAELAHAYAALAADGTDGAAQVRQWMRSVRAEQTFGLRDVAAGALAVPPDSVAVKCGWFGGERLHAVVLVEAGAMTVGATVTTYRPADGATSAAAREAGGDDGRLVAVHDARLGDRLRESVRRALLAADRGQAGGHRT